mmetsp:Transcript_14257/g.35930  ORF Transcript_14257/g.35930 Transcript_14257/m.35930 type:complete len:255 (-) Transcript_14257:209-973(-)
MHDEKNFQKNFEKLNFCFQKLLFRVGLEGGLVSLFDVLPVDDLPDGLDVVWPHVLVLEVVGVLPNIDSQQRHSTGERVLVWHRLHKELLGVSVQPQPAPAAALDADGHGGELLLEVVQAPEILVDLGQELALGGPVVALGAQVRPEDGVVQVAPGVEVDGLRQLAHRGEVTLGLGVEHLLRGRVDSVDVGLVVLAMVELHNFTADGGFEGGVVVGEVGKLGGDERGAGGGGAAAQEALLSLLKEALARRAARRQ